MTEASNSVNERLEAVRAKVARACDKYGRRAESVRIIAVSKTKPASMITEAYGSGQIDFGENYIQEAIPKIIEMHAIVNDGARSSKVKALQWHFIGPLQTNKIKFLVPHFNFLHTLDRESLAVKLNAELSARGMKMRALLQINIDEEDSKAGILPESWEEHLAYLRELPAIELKGLMCIPDPNIGDPARAFARLRKLLEKINSAHAYSEKLTELSMGMSGDFEAAIAEGATMIRLGTTIFGSRDPR